MNSEQPAELKTNSEGKQFKYEKNGVFYGGDYLEELPSEIDLEKTSEKIPEESQEISPEQRQVEVAKIDEQIQDEESGLREAREKLGLDSEVAEPSLAVQTLQAEKAVLVNEDSLNPENDPDLTWKVEKAREYLRYNSKGETADQASDRLREEGRAYEADIMLMAEKAEKLRQIDEIAEELKKIIEKKASDAGVVPLKSIMDGIDSVISNNAISGDFSNLESYFGSSPKIADIRKSVFQSAYVGNEEDAVKLLAFAKNKLQGAN